MWFHGQVAAFTIPYFSVTDEPPPVDRAPLCLSGVFSSNLMNGKYICERKFSVSWSRIREPTLTVVLSPLNTYSSQPQRKRWNFLGTSSTARGFSWIQNNLFNIVYKWEEILDALDAQITLSVLAPFFALSDSNPSKHAFAYEWFSRSSIIFDSDARQELLFDDRNFSNSKKYFWALQSLKIFTEYIDGTLRTISPIIYLANRYDDSPDDHKKGRNIINVIDEFRTTFEGLRDRVERKRQEVQTLRDGVGNPDTNAGTAFW